MGNKWKRRGELCRRKKVKSDIMMVLASKVNMCKQTHDKCVSMGSHPSNIRKLKMGLVIKTGKTN